MTERHKMTVEQWETMQACYAMLTAFGQATDWPDYVDKAHHYLGVLSALHATDIYGDGKPDTAEPEKP